MHYHAHSHPKPDSQHDDISHHCLSSSSLRCAFTGNPTPGFQKARPEETYFFPFFFFFWSAKTSLAMTIFWIWEVPS